MPNMKNAKKAVKTIEKKRIINNNYKASMKTAIKNEEKAILSKDKTSATEALKTAIVRLDKAGSAKVVTSNYVARNKSRLTKKVNEMK